MKTSALLFAPTPDFQLFNGLWNIVICTVAAVVLYNSWKVIVVRKNKPDDKGGLYLAYSMIFWVAIGILDLIDGFGLASGAYWLWSYHTARAMLGIWNSVFMLFAISYFEIVPPSLENLLRHRDWKKWMVGLGILATALTAGQALLLIGQLANPEPPFENIYTWNFIFSTLTVTILLTLILNIFQKESFQQLTWIGVALIVVILVSQFMEFQPAWFEHLGRTWTEFLKFLLLNIYKTLLLTFFALVLLSWAMREPPTESAPEIPTEEEICNRYNITPNEIRMLEKLAKGETREAVAEELFNSQSRDAVDDRLAKLASRFRIPNKAITIIVFALKNQIVKFDKV